MRLTAKGRYTDFALMSLGLNVASGSLADKRFQAKFDLCPLWVKHFGPAPGRASFDVRFAPKATKLLRSSGMSRMGQDPTLSS